MNINSMRHAVLLGLVFLALSAQSISISGQNEDSKELPPRGVLSMTGSVGFGDLSIKAPWGGAGAPVTGGISRTASSWTVAVSNVSEHESYSMNMELQQFNANRKKIKGNPLSYRLRPGESRSRDFPLASGAIGAALIVRSWKMTGSTAPAEEESTSSKTASERTDSNKPKPKAEETEDYYEMIDGKR